MVACGTTLCSIIIMDKYPSQNLSDAIENILSHQSKHLIKIDDCLIYIAIDLYVKDNYQGNNFFAEITKTLKTFHQYISYIFYMNFKGQIT